MSAGSLPVDGQASDKVVGLDRQPYRPLPTQAPMSFPSAMDEIRRRYFARFVLPKAAMNQHNYHTYVRFLVASGQLDDYESKVAGTLTYFRAAASPKQQTIIWKALFRVFPAGCGRWGMP